MAIYFRGDIFLAYYPYDEIDDGKNRPVIVLDYNKKELKVLVIKVTSKEKREESDIEIVHWKDAGLNRPSVARVSKEIILSDEDMLHYIGHLNDEDLLNILESYY